MDEQRNARQRPDALLQQQRVQHAAVIGVIQDDRPPLGGDATREPPANWNPDALADFLLQAAGRGGNQLAARIVQQQHRRGIGIQDLPDPAQQRGKEVISAQMRQRRIGPPTGYPAACPPHLAAGATALSPRKNNVSSIRRLAALPAQADPLRRIACGEAGRGQRRSAATVACGVQHGRDWAASAHYAGGAAGVI
jgi:hypothetical protein